MSQVGVFPSEINPIEAAKGAQVFVRDIPISELERFAPMLTDPSGVIHVRLAFSVNPGKLIQAELSLKGTASLACERCHEAMPHPIDETILLQLVKTQSEIDHLPLSIQPMEVNLAHQVEILPLIEDELILALPAFPLHEKKDCPSGGGGAYCASPEEEQNKSYKPFAGLSELAHSKEKK